MTNEKPTIDLPTEYNLTEQQMTQLTEDYAPENIPESNKKGDEGYHIIHERVMAITKVRTNIEKKRKELKADALAWGKKVDGVAAVLRGRVENLEAPWRERKTELEEAEAKAEEAARLAEQQRIDEIEARIQGIKDHGEGLLGKNSDTIKLRIDNLQAIEITEELFGDYLQPATIIRDTLLSTLTAAHEERTTFERQQAEQAEQKAALDAQQREIAEAQKRLDDEKAAQEATEAARKAAEEAAERKEREAQERIEREAAEAEAKEKREAELEKRMPEDVKVRKYADKLIAVAVPIVKDEALNHVLREAAIRLSGIHRYICDNTQEKK